MTTYDIHIEKERRVMGQIYRYCGWKLKEARERARLTIEDAAAALGVSTRAIYRREGGQAPDRRFSGEDWVKLLAFYGVKFEDLWEVIETEDL